MNHFFSRIFSGIFLGIGISISFFSFVFIYEKYHNRFDQYFSPKRERHDKNITSQIEIARDKKRGDTAHYTVSGELKNISTLFWQDILVKIDLYDSDEYIDSCTDLVKSWGYFSPGETERFKVQCSDILTNTNNFTYKIYIDYAYSLDKIPTPIFSR